MNSLSSLLFVRESSKIIQEVILLKRIILLLCLFFCLCPISIATSVKEEEEQLQETVKLSNSNYRFETLKAQIVEASEPYESDDEMKGKYQDLKVYINDGTIRTMYNLTASLNYYIDTTNYAKEYKVGDYFGESQYILL